MGMISEFKEFAMKGNMLDMAVGIIMGGAFGTEGRRRSASCSASKRSSFG